MLGLEVRARVFLLATRSWAFQVVTTASAEKCRGRASAQQVVSKLKRQLTEWEKIFANRKSDNSLISQIHSLYRKSPAIVNKTRRFCMTLM